MPQPMWINVYIYDYGRTTEIVIIQYLITYYTPLAKLNPFQPNFQFLYPLKMSENQRHFQGYRSGTFGLFHATDLL